MHLKYTNIGVVSNKVTKSLVLKKQLLKNKNFYEIQTREDIQKYKIDLILVLGGDGFMLHSIHNFMDFGLPFYGINCGTVGFLMNGVCKIKNISEILNTAQESTINPLSATFIDLDNKKHEVEAINEITLIRNSFQAAHIKVTVDGKERISKLISDGIIVATPAGSTSYNLSLQGPILPIGTKLLALTPISVAKPKGWRGAILPYFTEIYLDVLDAQTRKIKLISDYIETDNIKSVKIEINKRKTIILLFDSTDSIEERIIKEQFLQNEFLY